MSSHKVTHSLSGTYPASDDTDVASIDFTVAELRSFVNFCLRVPGVGVLDTVDEYSAHASTATRSVRSSMQRNGGWGS
jgi:hypothetical protein